MGTVFKGSLDLNSMCVEDAAPVCVVCICIESKLGGNCTDYKFASFCRVTRQHCTGLLL